MRRVLIAYDLVDEKRKSYDPLFQALRSMNATHVQKSVWVADTNATIDDVVRWLATPLDKDDRLCVVEVALGRGVNLEHHVSWLP